MKVETFKGIFSQEALTAEQKIKRDVFIKNLQKRSQKMIKGRFSFLQCPGSSFQFGYKFFKGEPIQKITISDDEIIDLPLDIAMHLNGCIRKVYKQNKTNLVSNKSLLNQRNYTGESRVVFIPVTDGLNEADLKVFARK